MFVEFVVQERTGGVMGVGGLKVIERTVVESTGVRERNERAARTDGGVAGRSRRLQESSRGGDGGTGAAKAGRPCRRELYPEPKVQAL